MRIFIAIDLPDPTRKALARLQASLPLGRIAAPETLHLTLAFAGDLNARQLEDLHEALQEVRAPAPEISIRGVGTFGKGTPAILHAEVPATRELQALRGKVLKAMRQIGIELPRERFRPHITLARFRKAMPPTDQKMLARFLGQNADFAAPGFAADHFTLFQSTLHPEGPVHEALAQYPLILADDGQLSGPGRHC